MPMPERNERETKEQIMRKLVLSIAAAGASLVTAPAIATPVNGLGALNAAATVDNVE
jgi:hypothetical protein